MDILCQVKRLTGRLCSTKGPRGHTTYQGHEKWAGKRGTSITKCSVVTTPSLRIATQTPGILEQWNAFCSRELYAFWLTVHGMLLCPGREKTLDNGTQLTLHLELPTIGYVLLGPPSHKFRLTHQQQQSILCWKWHSRPKLRGQGAWIALSSTKSHQHLSPTHTCGCMGRG